MKSKSTVIGEIIFVGEWVKKFKLVLLFIMLTSFACGSLYSPYDYLTNGFGARAVSMGGAYTGLSNDASAVFWNPAGFARVYNNQFSLGYESIYGGDNLYFAGFVQPVVYFGTFGAGVLTYNSANENNTGAFLSYAKDFYNYSLGITLKGFSQSVSGYTAFGFGADLGLSFYELDFITLSVVAGNIIKPVFTLDVSRSYPLVLKGGACVSLYDRRINFTIDVVKPEDTGFTFHGGLEYKPYNYLSIRAGIDHTIWTAGLGLSSGNYSLDYALTSLSANSNEFCHRFTAGIKFGSFSLAVKAEPRFFSPTGLNKTTCVSFKGTARYGTKSWEIDIRDVKGNSVKKIIGREKPPESFVWDALTETGELVKDGEYEIELTLVDKVNETERASDKVTVNTERPATDVQMEIQ